MHVINENGMECWYRKPNLDLQLAAALQLQQLLEHELMSMHVVRTADQHCVHLCPLSLNDAAHVEFQWRYA